MNESVMCIKGIIIDFLKKRNAQLSTKVELMVKKLAEIEIY